MKEYYKEYNKVFSWLDLTMSLAGEDIIKVNEVIKLNANFCLTELTRRKAKMEIENKILKER